MRTLLKSKIATDIFLVWIILMQYLLLGGSPLDVQLGWPSHQLTTNYSYGFIRRGFMGTLVSLFSQAFQTDTRTIIYWVQILGTIVYVALLLSFLFYFVNRIDGYFASMMAFLFVVMGGASLYFSDWGESDIYLISLTLVICLLIITDKFLWLVPFLVAICIMIHEGYVLMFFGLVVALLLYRIAFGSSPEGKKKYWICLLITGLTAFGLFIYFYFFSVRVSRDHIDEILRNAEQILRVPLQIENLKYIYAGTDLPQNAMWAEGKPTLEFTARMICVLLNIIVCLPVIIILVRFWKIVLKNNTDKKKKILLVTCLSCQLFILPLVLIQSDQARWFSDFVYFNFLFIASVLCIGDEKLSSAAEMYFKPSAVKILLISSYFVFFLNPDLQAISNHYRKPAQEITLFLARALGLI